MTATIPIQNSDLDFDYGTFDSAAFTAKALADWQSLAAVIDHSLLKPDATRQQVENLCAEAARYRFACVMVNPVWAATAVSLLAGTGIPVGAAIGFPLGASLVSTLRQEAAALIRLGARELDMVLPIGQLKSGNHHAVHHRSTPSPLWPIIMAPCSRSLSKPACSPWKKSCAPRRSPSRPARISSRPRPALPPAARPLPMSLSCAAWPARAAASRPPAASAPSRRPRPARSRRQPHRLLRLGRDPPRTRRRVSVTSLFPVPSVPWPLPLRYHSFDP